jgi:RHS repeat-associated protein
MLSDTRALGRPEAQTTTYTRNADGLVTDITDPLSRITRFQSDAAGRTVAVTDPLGRVTRSTWDPLDRILRVTDPQGNATQNTWDGNGNLESFTDARGKVTRWTYDKRNRPLTKTDARLKTETYKYDAAGNLAFLTDRKGQVSGYQHDALNRRTQAGYGASSTVSPVYTSTASLTWDAANRLTQIVDSEAGTITRTYDNRFDSITLETGPQGSVATTYYANGQRQSIDPTGGPAVTYSYDNADRLTGITQAAGAGPAEPATAQTVSLGYDNANRRTSLTLPNGIRAATAWDNASQLTSLTYRKADNSLIGDLGYTYDLAGQRTAIGGSLAASGLPDSVSASSHDDNNRLSAWNGATLTWDDNGNLLSDGTRSYTWDARDRLIAVSGPVPASFAYDPLGRRKSKTLAGVTTDYLYDGANPIQEKQGGAVSANLLSGPNLDEWYARTSAGQTQSYLPDALGSTLKLTNASQATTASYTYEPYGKATITGNPGTNSLTYTGREDDGTGLYYYRARYYHPGLSRFVQADPIGLDGGANLYSYVGGNPISFIDPSGLCTQAVWSGFNIVGWVPCGSPNPSPSPGPSPQPRECRASDQPPLPSPPFDPKNDAIESVCPECWILGGLRGWQGGLEITFGRNLRIAPFGNRTGHPYGELPHYHRRITDPTGQTVPGGGIGWHRPWEKGW